MYAVQFYRNNYLISFEVYDNISEARLAAFDYTFDSRWKDDNIKTAYVYLYDDIGNEKFICRY